MKGKSLNLGILSVLKFCLLGLVITLLGIVIFALVLKFADVPTVAISYVNNAIKAISIFFVVLCIKKNNEEKLLIRSIVAGIIYSVLSFVVFSIMNGGFVLDMSFVSDLLFAVVVSVVASVIINLFQRKNV